MITESFRETMTLIENAMETRVRGKGRDGLERDCDRSTSNMMYAAFVHRETRPVEGISDPHFHIHAFVFNATWDQEETKQCSRFCTPGIWLSLSGVRPVAAKPP